MRHTMVTYTVKPGREEANAALVRAVFEELVPLWDRPGVLPALDEHGR